MTTTPRRLHAAALTALGLLLVAAAPAAAIDINEDFKPQNEFKLDPWIPIEIGGIDFSINKAVLYIVLAGALTVGTLVWVANRMALDKPNKVQTVVETVYVGMKDRIAGENMDARMARRWFPFIATLFLFIWWSNMIGYLPLPTNTEHKVSFFGLFDFPAFALYAATANLSVPLVLTLIVWFSYHYEGIRAKGFGGYVKSWIPSGISGPILLLVAPIEVLSQFVRLVSLSARLFANILAGHLLILIMGGGLVVLLSLGVAGSLIIGIVTTPIAVAFFLFEVGLIATLQAFIFATLSAIYLGGATAAHH